MNTAEHERPTGAAPTANNARQSSGATEAIVQRSSPPPSGPAARVLGVAVLLTFVIALVLGIAVGEKIRGGAGKMISAATPHGPVAGASEKRQAYTCGMHPWVIQWKPGNCPICQMELTPIDPAKFTGKVDIDPVVVQNIGVRVQPVTTGPLVKTIRTVGTIDYAEPLVKDVNPKVGGWIEKLYVDEMGQQVKAGDRLFDLYSPELYAAQEEYLLAYRNRQASGAANANAQQMLASARTRLEFFDITPQQIAELEQSGVAAKTMAIRSPHTGVVIDKQAYEGMKIDPGTRVYRIADLSKVWVLATVYEYQLPYVQAGQKATITLPYIPGQQFEGKVVYIYPYLNEKVREAKARLEFENIEGLLKPGMFANVELNNELAKDRVLAPRSAVIDTGTRQVAFVSLGQGRFEPRSVKLGVETEDGMVEVLDGLKPGEMLVTSGQFLIDSEARIREALARMIDDNLAAAPTAAIASAAPAELPTLPDAVQAALTEVLNGYLAIGQQLVADATSGIDQPARAIAAGIDRMLRTPVPGDAEFWKNHEEAATVRGKALEIIDAADAGNLDDVRVKYADLSVALGKLLRATGVPVTFARQVDELHCPMYHEGQGGSSWLQARDADVQNPYFGTKMPGCFDRREALPSASESTPTTRPAASSAEEIETISRSRS